MEVAQNFIAAPPPDDTGGVCIDFPEEECHGAALSEEMGGYFFGMKSQFLTNVVTVGSNRLIERRSGKVFPSVPHLDGT